MAHALRSFRVRLGCIALALAACLLAAPASAQTLLSQATIGGGPRVVAVNPVNNKVYIARRAANSVRVIDAATGATHDIALTVGSGPTSLAVDPVTGTVVVGGQGVLAFIDGTTDALKPGSAGLGDFGAGQLFAGSLPISVSGAALDPATQTAYFPDTANNVVLATSGALVDSVTQVALGCAGPVAINPVTGSVYVGNPCQFRIDTFTGAGQGSAFVDIGGTPTALAVNPVTNKVYVALSVSGVAVIDGQTNAVTHLSTGFSNPTALAVNPVTNRIYVANGSNVVEINGADNTLTPIAVNGAAPNLVAISVDNVRNRIYVADMEGGLQVIAGDTHAVATLDLGGAPNSVAVNPVTSRVYVVDEANGVLSTIDGSELTGAPASASFTAATDAVFDPFRDRTFLPVGNTVVVARSQSEVPGPAIDLGSNVANVAVDPLSGNLFAVLPDATTPGVAVISTSDSVSAIPLGDQPFLIGVNPATQQVYLPNLQAGPPQAGRVDVIDARTSTFVTSVPIGTTNAFDMAIDAVHNRVYLADGSIPSQNRVLYRATGTQAVLSGGPTDFAFRIAANPVTGRVYILTAAGEVDEYDGGTASFVKGYPIAGASDLAVNSITNRVYVVNATTDVSVIDPVTQTVGTFPVSATANAVSLDELTDRIYVSTPTAIYVVDGETQAMIADIDLVTGSPLRAAVDPADGKAWLPITGNVPLIIKAANAQQSTRETFTAPLLPGAGQFVTSVSSPTFTATLVPGSAYSPNDPGGIVARSGADDLYGSNVTAANNGGTYSLGVPQPLAPGLHFLTVFATDNMSGTTTNSQAGTGGATGGLSYYTGPVATVPFVVVDPPSITNVPAPGTEGSAYSHTFTATGGTGGYAFTTADPLPLGLSLAPNGTLFGIPTFPGSFPFTVRVTDDSGGFTETAVTAVIAPQATGAATLTVALAASQSVVTPADTVTLSVTTTAQSGTPTGIVTLLDGSTPLVVQHTLDGTGSATFQVSGLSVGTHSFTVRYGGDATYQAATSAPAIVSVVTGTDIPRLGNISTRMDVLTGNNVMIAGFIIGGSTSKTVAITATGPSLVPFGITNPLANPTLTLVRQSDHAVIATNDDWQTDVNASQLMSSGFAPTDPHEAGLVVTLPPGAYTAIVSGAGGGVGVSVIGVFEIDHPEIPLINISTRGLVQGGNNVMIAGLIVQGSGPQKVVITATGPSLAPFGITNPLANPTLTLVRQSDHVVIGTNDDWQTNTNAADITASGFAPTDPHESALLVTLDPGAYTAIVSGVGGGTGVSVVGVFTLP